MSENGHLSARELVLVMEAQELVEARAACWETPPLAGSLVRCHLCERPLVRGRYVEAGGLLWCADLDACKARARKQLGVIDGPRRKRGDLRALEQVLRILGKARREQADWYVSALETARAARERCQAR